MGKPTGFLEYERVTSEAAAPLERIRHFNEFHTPLTEEQQKILCESGDEAGLFHNQKQDEMIEQYISDMEANGVEIIYRTIAGE